MVLATATSLFWFNMKGEREMEEGYSGDVFILLFIQCGIFLLNTPLHAKTRFGLKRGKINTYLGCHMRVG